MSIEAALLQQTKHLLTSPVSSIQPDSGDNMRVLRGSGGFRSWKLNSVTVNEFVADTYKEVLNISGSGVLLFAGITPPNNTTKTRGLKIELDGTTIFDASHTSDNTYMLLPVGLVGAYAVNSPHFSTYPIYDPHRFNQSCVISVMSNDASDSVLLYYAYRLF